MGEVNSKVHCVPFLLKPPSESDKANSAVAIWIYDMGLDEIVNFRCHRCGLFCLDLAAVVIHLNDKHGFSFLEIADELERWNLSFPLWGPNE